MKALDFGGVACKIKVYNKMKILIFSDTHLKKKFKPEKFRFLQKIISGADRVLINGDFWDGLFINFSEFVDSPWRRLFPLLKERRTVYLYGNHGPRSQVDKRVNLFSDRQGEQYRLRLRGKTLVVTHGHRFALSLFEAIKRLPLPRTFRRLAADFKDLFVRALGPRYVYWQYKHLNRELKEQKNKVLGDDEILISGHTHAAEMDLEHNFVNTGYIDYGHGQYLIVDDKTGEMYLYREQYAKNWRGRKPNRQQEQALL